VHEQDLKFTYLTGLAIDDLLARVRNLPPRTVILFASLAQDGAGRSFLPNEALALISGAPMLPRTLTPKTFWIAERLEAISSASRRWERIQPDSRCEFSKARARLISISRNLLRA